MTTLMFTTTPHSAPAIHPILTSTLGGALAEDERSIGDLTLVGSMVLNELGGFRSLQALMHLKQVDGILIFGSTAEAFGLGELVDFEPVTLRFRRQLTPVPAVRLPGGISRQWLDYDTHHRAIAAVKPLLLGEPEIIRSRGRHAVLGPEEFN
jgi:hypothetical protein